MKRLVAFLVIVLLAGGGFAYWKHVSAPPPPTATAVAVQSVSTTPVRSATMVDRVASYGNLVSIRSVDIVPETAGVVKAILFTNGQKVEAGAPLARMDSSIAQAQLQSAQAQAETDMQNLRRTQSLARQGLDSTYSTEQALSRAAASQADVKISESKLSQLVLRAPFAGTLESARVDVGAFVNGGDTIVRLEDTSELQVEFRIASSVALRMSPDAPVHIQVPGTDQDQIVEGKLSFIDPVVSTDTRSVLLRAVVHNDNALLRPGLYVRVSVDLRTDRDALVVPSGAVGTDLTSAYVFVVGADNIARRRDITLGLMDDVQSEVLDGVKAGEQVVSIGQFRLRDGDTVKIVPAPTDEKRPS